MRLPVWLDRITTNGQVRTILLGFIVIGFVGEFAVDYYRTWRNTQRFTALTASARENRQRIDLAVLEIRALVQDSPRLATTETLQTGLEELKKDMASLKTKIDYIMREERKRESEAWSPPRSKRK